MIPTGDYQRVAQAARPGPSPQQIAATILAGFDRHYALFRYGAQRAKALFEAGDWHGIQRLSRERIAYYDQRVDECAGQLNSALPRLQHADAARDADDRSVWQAIKQAFVGLLAGHARPECAETFFNSVSCHVLHRDYFQNDCLFVRPAVATDYLDSQHPSYRCYYPATHGLRRTLIRMMADFGLAAPFADLPRDVGLLARAALRELRTLTTPDHEGWRVEPDCQLQVLSTLFFRNKGAYVVGRLLNGGTLYPFAIPLLRSAAGRVHVDALLWAADDLSRLFSFTRAYFLVDMDTPSAYVSFLRTLLPNKPKAELYTMIGLQKQGKTLFYRDFLHHLRHSSDRFVAAPGIRGMVMYVFTLPSYPYVFKIIRDHIAKDGMDAATVRRKYRLVKLHDRVGRMADTWEYSQVALPRARFDPSVIDDLKTLAPSVLEEQGDTLIIAHVYIERRMTPLNLYLQHATPAQREHGVREYGDAIRQLAAANVFPGDMLFKNFGVTRLGRVVFYDYDEIQPMTEINFRRVPPAPYPEDELSDEPWYPVGPNDVFPEEFEHFVLADPRIRAVFLRHHAELLDADWWHATRQAASRGRIEDIFPYDMRKRFQAPSRLREGALAPTPRAFAPGQPSPGGMPQACAS